MTNSALFICKQRLDSYGVSFGLLNSATFVSNTLNESGITSKVLTVVDGNCIDRVVTENDPSHVFVEALWVTAEKFEQILSLPRHKDRKFIVRIHSKAPFIANEGIAFPWLAKYRELSERYPNFVISCNSSEFNESLSESLDVYCEYLPNIYNPVIPRHEKNTCGCGQVVDIACFGAIRPLKNHLNQAIAAIMFAERMGFKLRFHVNAGREEQKGDQVAKNLKALFAASDHELVEHGWMPHHEFVKVIASMDIGMQVSLSETFNIVAADFVKQGVPIVVSEEIDWMPWLFMADPNSAESMVRRLMIAYFGRYVGLEGLASWKLNRWNRKATKTWLKYFARE